MGLFQSGWVNCINPEGIMFINVTVASRLAGASSMRIVYILGLILIDLCINKDTRI